MRPSPHHLLCALVGFALALVLSAPVSAAADFARLASDGDLLPGGGTLLDFELPVLNEAGDVLVQARFDLEGDGSADGRVLLKITGPGVFTEIARTGDPLGNGTSIALFRTDGVRIYSHYLADNGRAAFMVNMTGGGRAILHGIGAAPIEFLHDGDPAPGGAADQIVSSLSLIGYTDDGDIVYSFRPQRPGWTDPVEVWRGSARLIEQGQIYGSTTVYDPAPIAMSETGDVLVAADVVADPDPDYRAWLRPFEGDLLLVIDELAPVPSGGTFALDVYSGLRFFNSQLAVGFGAYIQLVPPDQNHGAYLDGGGSPSAFVRAGDASSLGGVFSAIDEIDFNNANQMLIRGNLLVEGVPGGIDAMFLALPGGTLTPFLVEGDPDPLGTGTLFSFSSGALNDAGRAALLGRVLVGGMAKNALFHWDGQTVTTVAQEGVTFDGQVPDRVDFAGRVGVSINRRAHNEAGQVTFLVEGPIRRAVYRYDSTGPLDAPPRRDRPAVVLEAARPNPFNPKTSLFCMVQLASDVDLAVYDLMGRRVRTLFRGRLDVGRHRLEWNGRDEADRVVASGAYVARLRTPEGEVVRSLMLVK